jgi:hypothetical protein
MVSLMRPPPIVSLPSPPWMLSAPPRPFSWLAPLPMRVLASSLPVPLMVSAPVRVRFSILDLSPRSKVTELLARSPVPPPATSLIVSPALSTM